MRWSQRPRQTSAPAARRTSRTRYSSPRRRHNAQALATWAIESTKHHTAIPVPKGAGRLRHARIAKLVKAASQHRHAKTTGPSAAAATICSCRAATATATATSGPPAGRTSTTRSPCPPSAAHLAGTADGAPTPATPTPGTRRPGTTCPPRAMAWALSCPCCAASTRRPTGRSRDAAGTDPKTPGATAAASAALGRQAAAAAPATHVINRPGLPRRPARTQPGPAAKDKPDP
jgi:hypothetical protein